MEADPHLFTGDKRLPEPIGAVFHDPDANVRRAYPNQFTLAARRSPAGPPTRPRPRQLVWHPDAPDSLPANTFATLAALLDKARPGDEVLIRHNGLLPPEGDGRTAGRDRAGGRLPGEVPARRGVQAGPGRPGRG